MIIIFSIDTWIPLKGDNELDMIIDDNLFDINDIISYIVNLGISNCSWMI